MEIPTNLNYIQKGVPYGKKFIIYLLKPFSFLPAIAMMYLIFSFSAQTGTESGNLSHEISYHLVSVADRVLDKGLSEEEKNAYADKIEFPVRKLEHMTEYFILAICMSFPLICIWRPGLLLFLSGKVFSVWDLPVQMNFINLS